jgi:hypothetical protein
MMGIRPAHILKRGGFHVWSAVAVHLIRISGLILSVLCGYIREKITPALSEKKITKGEDGSTYLEKDFALVG